MQKRWAPAFTVVELIIVITVIAILVVTVIVSYAGVQRSANIRAAQSDLTNIAAQMQLAFQRTGTYPSTLPSTITPSNANITLSLKAAGTSPYYSNLSTVQNGVLFSQICSDLISEGVGKGVDQGGNTQDYVMGCGNWNNNSMQISAWQNRIWPTPLSKSQLVNYATNYTVSDPYHKAAQEKAVKSFYTQIVSRLEQQGGVFPITSFWDYWAAPGNGGVAYQPLDTNPPMRSYYCAEATVNNTTEVWHVDQNAKLEQGTC